MAAQMLPVSPVVKPLRTAQSMSSALGHGAVRNLSTLRLCISVSRDGLEPALSSQLQSLDSPGQTLTGIFASISQRGYVDGSTVQFVTGHDSRFPWLVRFAWVPHLRGIA